jgi:hypothetical protein
VACSLSDCGSDCFTYDNMVLWTLSHNAITIIL